MVSTTGMVVSLKTDLRFPIPGQQGHGSRIIHSSSSFGNSVSKYLMYVVHIQFVGSGSFCNAVDDCTGLCSPDGIDGHPVLASKSRISQCSFVNILVR